MKLKLDLHIHSKESPDGRMTIEEIIAEAKKIGLDGAAVCDHDTLTSFEKQNVPDDFMLIPGEEFSTKYGHILGLFLTEPILSTDPSEIIHEIHKQNGISVLAHPFERHRDPSRFNAIIDMLDGVEIWNGRANRKNKQANEMAVSFARKHGFAFFAGSDAHVPREIGNGCVTVNVDVKTEAAIKRALLSPENEVSGKEGRQIDVARSQWTKLNEKKNANIFNRLKWFAFALKCVAGDLFIK